MDTGAILGGIAAILASVLALYYQQKNRRQDKSTTQTLDTAAARVQETAAAFDAWRNISNQQQIEMEALRRQNAECEKRSQELQNAVVELRIQLAKVEH